MSEERSRSRSHSMPGKTVSLCRKKWAEMDSSEREARRDRRRASRKLSRMFKHKLRPTAEELRGRGILRADGSRDPDKLLFVTQNLDRYWLRRPRPDELEERRGELPTDLTEKYLRYYKSLRRHSPPALAPIYSDSVVVAVAFCISPPVFKSEGSKQIDSEHLCTCIREGLRRTVQKVMREDNGDLLEYEISSVELRDDSTRVLARGWIQVMVDANERASVSRLNQVAQFVESTLRASIANRSLSSNLSEAITGGSQRLTISALRIESMPALRFAKEYSLPKGQLVADRSRAKRYSCYEMDEALAVRRGSTGEIGLRQLEEDRGDDDDVGDSRQRRLSDPSLARDKAAIAARLEWRFAQRCTVEEMASRGIVPLEFRDVLVTDKSHSDAELERRERFRSAKKAMAAGFAERSTADDLMRGGVLHESRAKKAARIDGLLVRRPPPELVAFQLKSPTVKQYYESDTRDTGTVDKSQWSTRQKKASLSALLGQRSAPKEMFDTDSSECSTQSGSEQQLVEDEFDSEDEDAEEETEGLGELQFSTRVRRDFQVKRQSLCVALKSRPDISYLEHRGFVKKSYWRDYERRSSRLLGIADDESSISTAHSSDDDDDDDEIGDELQLDLRLGSLQHETDEDKLEIDKRAVFTLKDMLEDPHTMATLKCKHRSAASDLAQFFKARPDLASLVKDGLYKAEHRPVSDGHSSAGGSGMHAHAAVDSNEFEFDVVNANADKYKSPLYRPSFAEHFTADKTEDGSGVIKQRSSIVPMTLLRPSFDADVHEHTADYSDEEIDDFSPKTLPKPPPLSVLLNGDEENEEEKAAKEASDKFPALEQTDSGLSTTSDEVAKRRRERHLSTGSITKTPLTPTIPEESDEDASDHSVFGFSHVFSTAIESDEELVPPLVPSSAKPSTADTSTEAKVAEETETSALDAAELHVILDLDSGASDSHRRVRSTAGVVERVYGADFSKALDANGGDLSTVVNVGSPSAGSGCFDIISPRLLFASGGDLKLLSSTTAAGGISISEALAAAGAEPTWSSQLFYSYIDSLSFHKIAMHFKRALDSLGLDAKKKKKKKVEDSGDSEEVDTSTKIMSEKKEKKGKRKGDDAIDIWTQVRVLFGKFKMFETQFHATASISGAKKRKLVKRLAETRDMETEAMAMLQLISDEHSAMEVRIRAQMKHVLFNEMRVERLLTDEMEAMTKSRVTQLRQELEYFEKYRRELDSALQSMCTVRMDFEKKIRAAMAETSDCESRLEVINAELSQLKQACATVLKDYWTDLCKLFPFKGAEDPFDKYIAKEPRSAAELTAAVSREDSKLVRDFEALDFKLESLPISRYVCTVTEVCQLCRVYGSDKLKLFFECFIRVATQHFIELEFAKRCFEGGTEHSEMPELEIVTFVAERTPADVSNTVPFRDDLQSALSDVCQYLSALPARDAVIMHVARHLAADPLKSEEIHSMETSEIAMYAKQRVKEWLSAILGRRHPVEDAKRRPLYTATVSYSSVVSSQRAAALVLDIVYGIHVV